MVQGKKKRFLGVSVRVIALVAVASVALAGFVISPAFGGPGFLTKNAARKTYVTKKVVKKTYITKKATGQKYITKDDANTAFAPRRAETTLAVSPANWISAGSGATQSVTYFSGEADLTSTAAGTFKFYNAALTLPAVLQGQPVSVKSFELCYAASAAAKITRVFMFSERPTSAAPHPSGATPISDDTERTDDTCRTYAAASPVALDPSALYEIVLRADFTAGSNSVNVSRLTVDLTS